MEKGIKSPLNYFGGKSVLAPWIITHFPEHKVYVEPFGGAAHVLCRKDPGTSRLEVYNDVCRELVNLFRVLQDENKLEELVFLVSLTPHSRKWYCDLRDCKYLPPGISEDVRQAYRTLIMMKQSFSGHWLNRTGSWAFDLKDGSVTRSFYGLPDKIRNLVDRLRKVQIDCIDFRECIRRYDSIDTLFYCDPPYFGKERYYEGQFGEKDHKDLAEILNRVKGKVCLSYYEFPGVFEWYPPDKWKVEKRNISKPSNKVKDGEKRARADELLFMNY